MPNPQPSPPDIANTLASIANSKSQGTQHIDMDPVTVEGGAFCPTCGNQMPEQHLPAPYKPQDDK